MRIEMTSMKSNLRRSRTIAEGDYVSSGVEEKENSPETFRPASNSCQALKHAVSALTRLDDFILEKVGQGFFAEVFKVTHKSTGQVMALKMNINSSNRYNMLQEIQLMNRLSHPNILRFLGVCVHEGQLHALTEFMNGGSLDRLIADENIEMPWTLRINLSSDIAKGMKYLHSRGIFHRDLTSRNILLRVEDNVYHAVVSDFGLAAKVPDPLDKSTKLPIVGSPYWMAPETLNGLWYGPQADVFSFGIIACEITARIDADPDIMPRTLRFGVDYIAFCEKVEYCPLDFLRLAFTCCQIEPTKRPTFSDIVTSLEKIQKLLKEDPEDLKSRKRKDSGRHGHKRSLSADNILASSTDDVSPMTPQVVGEVMSKDDPFYSPVGANPFAAYESYGGKILGYSRNGKDSYYSYELPSPSVPHTPPGTPIMTPEGTLNRKKHSKVQQTQSLPSSPILLRKAAEQFHLESLHGSNCRRNSAISGKRYSLHFPKSKSASVMPESLASRLESEFYDEDSVKSSSNEQRTRRYLRQLSADTPHTYNRDNNIDLTNGLGDRRSENPTYQNDVRGYRMSRSSTDSFNSIEEQVMEVGNSKMTFISETLSEDSQTTLSSDGAILETHL
ncbi:dual specificity testis-specific protein kinase 2-like [Saccostrea echinata]|uniref:dual specificity testis-specific protein kinase 2-like n=1 Tax=Saccostrea echinata TaxID=191078 RepID=UPI002A7EE817|nr:dual specificity testis-specific protein kinase 2-like [Saccostrea echinata]